MATKLLIDLELRNRKEIFTNNNKNSVREELVNCKQKMPGKSLLLSLLSKRPARTEPGFFFPSVFVRVEVTLLIH